MNRRRCEFALLVLIVVAGGLLRLGWSGAQSLWLDEGFTLLNATWPLEQMLLQPTDETPFLYYWLHQLLLPNDPSIVAVRSISLAAAVASLIAIYALGRLLLGPAAGLVCVSLLAVWSAHIDYSTEARAYSLLMLLSLLTSIGLAVYARGLDLEEMCTNSALELRRRTALALFAIANLLSFYTHLTAVFWIAASSILLLMHLPQLDPRYRREIYLTFSLMALAASPGIYRLTGQLLIGHHFGWLEQADFWRFLSICADIMLPRGFWNNALGLDLRWLLTCLMVLLLLWWWFGRPWANRSNGTEATGPKLARMRKGLLLAYLLTPAALWLVGFIATPLFMPRTLLFCSTGMILLLSAMCIRADRSLRRGLAIALIAVYLASSLLFGVVRKKENWRGVSAKIASVAQDDDVVLLCMPIGFAPIRYHWQKARGPLVLAVQSTFDPESGPRSRIIELESQLGTNEDWANGFRLGFLVPDLEARLRRPISGRGTGESWAIHTLLPGSVLLRIDNRCVGLNKRVADSLGAAVSTRSELIWRDALPSPIEIRRYVVETATTVSMLRFIINPN